MFRPTQPRGLRQAESEAAPSALSRSRVCAPRLSAFPHVVPDVGRLRKPSAHACPTRRRDQQTVSASALLVAPSSSSNTSSSTSTSSHSSSPNHSNGSSSSSSNNVSSSQRPPPSRRPSRAERDASVPHTPEELLDAKLYEEIRGCETWQDVLDVVTDECATMCKSRAVQALGRFGTLFKSARLTPQARAEATGRPGFQQLLQRLYARLPDLNPAQASSVVLNLAQLSISLEEEHLVQLTAVLRGHVMQYTARDISTIMHSMSSLAAASGGEASRALMDTLSDKACTILRGQRRQQQVSESSSTSSDSDSAAHPAAAAAEPTSQPSDLPAAEPRSPPKRHGEADAFTPQGICMLLNSAARLQYKNTRLLTAATEVALEQMSSFTPQGISNVLWATARLDHYFPALVTAALGYFGQHRQSFRPQELSNIMAALCKLRHHPQLSSQLLAQALLSRDDAELRPADFAALLNLLSTFCIFPGKQAMAQLCRRLELVLPQCSAGELCECLRALGLLGETRRPVFAQIAGMLPARFERGELDDGLQRQVFQALLCATLGESAAREAAAAPDGPAATAAPSPETKSPASTSTSSVPSFPPLMMDSMKRLWLSTVQGGAYRANRDASPTKAVSDTINDLHVRHDSARATKDGLVLIDIALRPSKERYVALQVLRGFDHTRNTDQLLGSVQLERQILEMNGWEVKYLLYQDLLQVAPDARLFFIAEYLKNIGCRIQREVAAPSSDRTTAAAAARPSKAKLVVSEAAREANILLRDPKSNGPRARKP